MHWYVNDHEKLQKIKEPTMIMLQGLKERLLSKLLTDKKIQASFWTYIHFEFTSLARLKLIALLILLYLHFTVSSNFGERVRTNIKDIFTFNELTWGFFLQCSIVTLFLYLTRKEKKWYHTGVDWIMSMLAKCKV